MVLSFLCACSGFKSGAAHEPLAEAGADASMVDGAIDAARDAAALSVGPGPRGALPTGFCCTRDDECRYRHCVQVGATMMCSDECTQSGFCRGGAVDFTCAFPDGGRRGLCMPENGQTPSCVPQDRFTYGAKKLGECCAFGLGGRAGWECEGALCLATGKNPFVCSHHCESADDCPGAYDCALLAGSYRACLPAPSVYTCK